MATKVHMEALSPTMEEGQLVKWLKNEGDDVAEGDILAEIETDKATMELVARGSGVLRKQLLKEGQSAEVGSVIGVIGGADEDVSAAAGDAGDAAPAMEKSEPGAEKAAAKPDADEDEAAAEEEPEAEAAPAQAERPARTDRTPTPAEVGPTEQHRAEAMTQAPGRPGHPAHEGAGASDDEDAEEPAQRAAQRRPDDGAASRAGGDGRTRASPLARRLAEEAGVELSGLQGSGPGGRIVKRDIEAARSSAQARPAAAAKSAAPARAPIRAPDGPEVEEIPVSQMRKTIAKRLVTSIGPVPTFYLTTEIDMTRIAEARERVNERLADAGVKVSINDLIVKGVAVALARHPEINASWGDDVVRRYRRVHIGVAVAVEDGLITPVIRDADRKGVAEIAQEVRELAGRARERKLKPDEYTGATFSISNLGMFGIDEFTAIINPPEAAILAIGRIEEKPVVIDGAMEIQPRMRVTMSCDHRVIDGATGARFLQTVRELLEEPVMMLV